MIKIKFLTFLKIVKKVLGLLSILQISTTKRDLPKFLHTSHYKSKIYVFRHTGLDNSAKYTKKLSDYGLHCYNPSESFGDIAQ